MESHNFQFLSSHSKHLLKLASEAELLCYAVPDLSLTRLRQLLECIATSVLQQNNLLAADEQPDLYSMTRSLANCGAINREIADAFHSVRKLANPAVHSAKATEGEAIHALKLSRAIAIWFHRLKKPGFQQGKFHYPSKPSESPKPPEEGNQEEGNQALEEIETENEALRSELEILRRKVAATENDLDAALALAEELEGTLQKEQESFIKALESQPEPTRNEIKKVEAAAAEATPLFIHELDEAATRRIIDDQLVEAGWLADSENLRYAKGTRPEKNVAKAIAEWPTKSGPVDYALFIGQQLVGVVEAKKHSVSLPSVLGQAERYARDIKPGNATFPEGSPWENFKAPLLYVANGRPFLKQLEDESGVHMRDLRLPTNKRAVLDGWPSPEGITALLTADIVKADADLADAPIDLPGLRKYQIKAIDAVEKAIAKGQREILLAMATGTGKTRTALSLFYRLVKAKRFRRILFLVDRTTLGEQAAEAFQEVKLDQLQSFSEIYNIKELGDIRPDEETRLQIATIQGMVKRVLFPADDQVPPPVDQYDCVVIDECHRGYNLDREMAEHELEFRSEADFISKYTRVLDHFHAVKIGLTATPAHHTEQIFGRPVHTYSYREAVTDGYLCDHEPPVRFVTRLAKEGIKWKKGETIDYFVPKTKTIETEAAPDEVLKNVEAFNLQVVTEPFNQVICEELATFLDPEIPGKCLVFCANDRHADLFVKCLKAALDDLYGPQRDDLVRKITGSAMAADSDVYTYFKNEANPKIAVTVDLLTTGIDIPEITSLVFVRRVKSRILYEQMIGRATRLCPNLFGPDEHKEVFQIFDTVDLYASLEKFSTMKPVVTRPGATVSDLVQLATKSIHAKPDDDSQPFYDQLVAKLRRKRTRIEKAGEYLATRFNGLTPAQFFETLDASPLDTLDLFDAYPGLADWIDELPPGKQHRLLISHHEDELLVAESGYGEGNEKPEDYLERFGQWIDEHKSTHEALTLVLTQPSSLKRSELKKLALEMGDAGFLEPHLREAWREVKHEDCAARLIGYIRAHALGSPLVPFPDRVDAAVTRLLANEQFSWTKPRRQWLERIAKQVKKEIIVDESNLQQGAFVSSGGYARIDKIFKGQLDDMLTELHTGIWQDDEVA